MFAIISNGKLLELCNDPSYIRYDEETQSYVKADNSDEATGIVVDNQYYSIPDFCEQEVYEGAPVAVIEYVGNGRRILFNTYVQANQTTEDVITIEDALLEFNGTTLEDLDDIRGAIFDLANQMAESH